MAKPKLIVFDLDYTLWPFWCDTHVSPPFTKNKSGEIRDRYGQLIECFPNVPSIIAALHKEGYQIAAASRTETPDRAHNLLKLFEIEGYFHYKEIYPGNKRAHFQRFQKLSGIDYKDMLFFDDEHRNIVDISKIGVTCIFIDEDVGFNENVLKEGLRQFAEKNSNS